MAKKEIDQNVKEIKVNLQEGKVVVGKDLVLKNLRAKKMSKVFLASNCPQDLKDDVKRFSELANISLVELEQDNEELGIICKKNFFISVLGIIGE